MDPISSHDQHLVDLFLTGRLSEQERIEFETRLEDPAFRNMVSEMEDVRKALQQAGRLDLKALLTTWDRGQVARHTRRRWLWRSAAAASVLIVIVAVWFAIQPTSTSPYAGLLENYMQPYPNVVEPIEKGESASSEYGEAYKLYELGQYESALGELNKLDDENEAVQFYSGICALMLDKYRQAIQEFKPAVEDDQHQFHIPAMWYTALAYLNMSREAEARTLLEAISEDKSPLALRARALLNEL